MVKSSPPRDNVTWSPRPGKEMSVMTRAKGRQEAKQQDPLIITAIQKIDDGSIKIKAVGSIDPWIVFHTPAEFRAWEKEMHEQGISFQLEWKYGRVQKP